MNADKTELGAPLAESDAALARMQAELEADWPGVVARIEAELDLALAELMHPTTCPWCGQALPTDAPAPGECRAC